MNRVLLATLTAAMLPAPVAGLDHTTPPSNDGRRPMRKLPTNLSRSASRDLPAGPGEDYCSPVVPAPL